MKRLGPYIVLVGMAGCGVGGATSPPVASEVVHLDPNPETVSSTAPEAQAVVPFAYADATTPPSSFLTPSPETGGSADVLGALLDALLVNMLAPSPPRFFAPVRPGLVESTTFLERLCLEGDDLDTFCHQRFGR